MSQQTSAARKDITFEDGYEDLKSIVARLGQNDVPVHEVFEGLRRGKGLEKSLRAYLTELEGELTEIEAGNGLPEFNIVAPSRGAATAPTPDVPVREADFAPARGFQSSVGVGDDDIPF